MEHGTGCEDVADYLKATPSTTALPRPRRSWHGAVSGRGESPPASVLLSQNRVVDGCAVLLSPAIDCEIVRFFFFCPYSVHVSFLRTRSVYQLRVVYCYNCGECQSRAPYPVMQHVVTLRIRAGGVPRIASENSCIQYEITRLFISNICQDKWPRKRCTRFYETKTRQLPISYKI